MDSELVGRGQGTGVGRAETAWGAHLRRPARRTRQARPFHNWTLGAVLTTSRFPWNATLCRLQTEAPVQPSRWPCAHHTLLCPWSYMDTTCAPRPSPPPGCTHFAWPQLLAPVGPALPSSGSGRWCRDVTPTPCTMPVSGSPQCCQGPRTCASGCSWMSLSDPTRKGSWKGGKRGRETP